MNLKYVNIISSRKIGNIISMFIAIILLSMTLIQFLNKEYSLESVLVGSDDWSLYASQALDIKNNGLLIKSVSDEYLFPGGFLYNYFIATCFVFFGESLLPIYFIQTILLGLSINLIYQTFRDEMKPVTGYYFLMFLFIFGLLDVYKYYTFQLFSENLAIFTLSAFFYYFRIGFNYKKINCFLFSAFFLGISVLIRPNVFPFSVVLLILLIYLCFKREIKFIWLNLFFIVFVVSASFLAIRNYLVTENISFLPMDGNFFDYISRDNPFSLIAHPGPFFTHYVKKIIFCFGFLPILETNYNIRPHWLILWYCYFIFMILQYIKKIKNDRIQLVIHLFVFSFFGTLVFVAPIEHYGFRILIPGIFFVLVSIFLTYDKLEISESNKDFKNIANPEVFK